MLSRAHTGSGNAANYKNRGIKVCDRWLSFSNFLADMGERPSPAHSIERNDNNGDYEPGNCRWATAAEQARNRRSNRVLTIRGEQRCAIDWAAETAVPLKTIYQRLRDGWPDEMAVFTPVYPRTRRYWKRPA